MRTKDVAYIAAFAGVTAALALFPPLPLSFTGVPVTAQSLGPMLAGSIIGAKRGFLSQLLLLALVAIGLPLLAGGTGGLGVFSGPNGGYLIGWAVGALVIGWIYEIVWRRLNLAIAIVANVFGGIVVVYALGSAWVWISTGLGFWQSISANGPFLPGDACKVAIAAVISIGVKRAYPVMEPRSWRGRAEPGARTAETDLP